MIDYRRSRRKGERKLEKLKQIVKDKYNTTFAIILLIAILSRILFLEEFPDGIDQDEAGMMYDAYCMAEYGTDRYLNENPVYLINFWGGQSVMYAAIASLLIRVFGFSVFVVRLPAVIFSILTIILAYSLTKKYIGKKFALILAFFITICSWHIMQSRWGLDCNLLASFMLVSVYVFLNAKKDWHYIAAGICWGLTLYTYALSYIMLPVFFIVLCIYLLYVKRITIKQILITIIPILALAIPLILFQVVNYFEIGTIKIGFVTIPQLFRYRISEIGFDNVLYNLNIGNRNNYWFLLFSSNKEAHTLKEFGTIYYILIPFVIWGFVLVIRESIKTIKKKEFNLKTVFLIQFITVSVCVLFFYDLLTYKLNPLYIMLLVFATEATVWIYERRKMLGNCIVIASCIVFVIFEVYYFKNINEKVNFAYNTDFIPLIEYLEQEYPNKEIYMETDAMQQYIYLLLAKKMSPYEFMNDKKFLRYIGGEIEVIRVGRYHFLIYEIDKDMVYVVEENNLFKPENEKKIRKELEENGFSYERYQNFLIYTYSE